MGTSNIFSQAAQAATLVGAVVYAYGWYFLSVVLSEWSLSPEDVGVTFSFLVVRLAPLLMLVVAPAYLAVLWLDKHDKTSITLPPRVVPVAPATGESPSNVEQDDSAADQEEDGVWVLVIGVGGLIFGYLLVVGFISLGFEWVVENWFGVEDDEVFLDRHEWLYAVLFFGPAAIGFALIVVFDWWEDFRRKQRQFRIGPFAKVVRGILALAVVGGLLYLPFPSREAIADEIEQGKSVDVGLSFINLLRFQQVQLTVDGEEQGCVVLLGVGSGFGAFVDPQDGRVFQVPTARVAFERGCSENR